MAKKFKNGDWVRPKTWEALKEEFDVIPIETIREKMRKDEMFTESDEDYINNYNVTVLDCKFGIRKDIVEELEKKEYYIVTGYDEETGELLLDCEAGFMVSDDMFILIPEEEKENYSFWKKKDVTVALFETVKLGNSIGINNNSLEKVIKETTKETLGYEEFSYFLKLGLLNRTYKANEKHLLNRYLSGDCYIRLSTSNGSTYADPTFRGVTDYIPITFLMNTTKEDESRWADNDKIIYTKIEDPAFPHFCGFIREKQSYHALLCMKEDFPTEKDFSFVIEFAKVFNQYLECGLDSVCDALAARDKGEYYKALENIAEEVQVGLKEIEYTLNVDKLVEYISVHVVDNLTRTINNYKNEINDIIERHRTLLHCVKEYEMKLFYAKYKESEKFTDVRKALEIMKNDFDDFQMEYGVLKCSIIQPMLYWEDDIFENLLDSEFFEDQGLTSKGVEVFKQIFLERKYTLIFKQLVEINVETNRVRALSTEISDKYIPNPHLNAYNCWADNETKINKYLSESDYINAFIQIKSTIAGLALYDSEVVRTFVRYLTDDDYYSDSACLQTEDGELITFEEAVNRL